MNKIIKNLVETHYNLTSLILSIKSRNDIDNDKVNLDDYEIAYLDDSYVNVVATLDNLMISNTITSIALKSYYTQILKRKLDCIFNIVNKSSTANELFAIANEYKTCLDILDKTKDIHSVLL